MAEIVEPEIGDELDLYMCGFNCLKVPRYTFLLQPDTSFSLPVFFLRGVSASLKQNLMIQSSFKWASEGEIVDNL